MNQHWWCWEADLPQWCVAAVSIFQEGMSKTSQLDSAAFNYDVSLNHLFKTKYSYYTELSFCNITYFLLGVSSSPISSRQRSFVFGLSLVSLVRMQHRGRWELDTHFGLHWQQRRGLHSPSFSGLASASWCFSPHASSNVQFPLLPCQWWIRAVKIKDKGAFQNS